jgi:hypothetical protein
MDDLCYDCLILLFDILRLDFFIFKYYIYLTYYNKLKINNVIKKINN